MVLARGVEEEREGEERSARKRERGVVQGWGFGEVWCGAGRLGNLDGREAGASEGLRLLLRCLLRNMEGRRIRTSPERTQMLHERHEHRELAVC